MTTETQTMPTGHYWQGKTKVERIVLPFQNIETINESRATREKEKKSGSDGKNNTGSPLIFSASNTSSYFFDQGILLSTR